VAVGEKVAPSPLRDRRRGGERRSYQEEPNLLGELDRALDAVAPTERKALVALRREYTVFARRNAHRLATLGKRLLITGLLFVVAQMALGVWGLRLQVQSTNLSRQNRDTLKQVQAGRQTSLGVACAVESAVAQSGRAVIAGSAKPPSAAEERALEALGFPPYSVRQRQQKKAADAYVAEIAKRIDQQIGSKGDGLVRPGGTLDCKRFEQIAHAAP
jgi:hypothetical protein